MTNEERYQKYIKENCKKCKNKNNYDCEIRIHRKDDTIVTRCEYYERED